jgi:hypothetical protein
MTYYHFRLQQSDGSPADPPTYRSTVLTWRQGDTIPLGRGRIFASSGFATTMLTSRRSWSLRTCRVQALPLLPNLP